MVDDAADELVNPRPSGKIFASLAEREEAHAHLLREALVARTSGDLDTACEHLREAYALLFRTKTLLSLVGTKLNQGEAELAVACYTKILQSGALSDAAERRRVTARLCEARQMHAEVRAIVDAEQAARLNSVEQRERTHRTLTERAKVANERPDRAQAEALFLEAWPLLFRPSVLISATNMLAHAVRAEPHRITFPPRILPRRIRPKAHALPGRHSLPP
jgi:rubrerythrin